ncbi:MAG: RND transporter [Curvibacter sp. RIFCSPHIGHO2_12_FULL_63_18]|uniref:efflux transporter outer membrane subunit n=1 Tax=Rhodoferax sp. TaxID=50421 RepID=UPI0008B3F65A|nr:efflux transporter outer membrane subunit [Rhodoferax sp.]OGO94996.1 MAG: RND transporter [Curvibacter sp. GWA2_63_95]OGP05188.1 MAG: RND transporter [Curvibacter sp. RIFCSPHIGHO2_12_FULL_63_18]HCX82325.1 RND transporter [Rhodoferax sp.]
MFNSTTASSRALRWSRFALSAAALASLSACANFSGIFSQAKPVAAQQAGLSTQAIPADSVALNSQWWKVYGDEQLNQLVDKALANNPSLRVAQARVQRVMASIDNADAAGAPQLNASLDATRQLYTRNGLVPAPIAGSERDIATLQASGNWELDLFGKNRAALDAAIGQSRAAQADAQAARMLLASNVARSYFQWMRVQAQLEVAQRTLTQREQTKQLVQDRLQAGLDTQLELQQSESGLPDARFQIEVLREQEALLLNTLSALTSQQNSPLALLKPAQAAINSIANAQTKVQTVPLDLLGRRADVVAARWRVEAATRDVDNAKTLFYPNINLTAFAGFSSIGFDKLVQSSSAQWGVGPAIRLPLFEGGRLRANLKGKTADLDAAIETYNAAVVDAVRDVADQLASTQAISRQQREQKAAQQSAESAYAIAVQRFEAGLGNYLNVLTAETAVLTQRKLGVDLAARSVDTQIQLIRALGGGFNETDISTAQAGNTAAH